MGKLRIQCEHCSSVLAVPESTLGKKVRCPKCQGIILVAATKAEDVRQVQKNSPDSTVPADRKKRKMHSVDSISSDLKNQGRQVKSSEKSNKTNVPAIPITQKSSDENNAWYYQSMGESVGPIGAAELLQQFDKGRLDSDTPVKRSGDESWGELRAFLKILRSPSPAPIEDFTSQDSKPESSPTPVDIPESQHNAAQHKECPFCSEQILATARKCKHCGEMLTEISEVSEGPDLYAGNPANATPKTMIQWLRYFSFSRAMSPIVGDGPMGPLGSALLIFGVFLVIATLFMDTSVETDSGGRVHNIGLMQQQQNYLIVCIGIVGLGVILVFAGRRNLGSHATPTLSVGGQTASKKARTIRANSSAQLIPELPPKKIDRGAETAGIWAKRRILIAVGGTALLAVCLTIVAIIFFAANHTPEEERLQLVGTWRFDGSNESQMAELSEKLEKQNEVLALDKEQKGLILDAMKAKIRESLFNCTLELQREGVAIMTVPRLKRDGSDALVETGTWEVAGSKSELKLRLSYGQKGIWVPIRFDSDDQFTQIFPSHTLTHYRQL